MNQQLQEPNNEEFDAIVVGAGFSGMYLTHLLTQQGFTVRGIERGTDVGGTWYWNRYPGCRCDVESMEYSYQFSQELEQSWEWTERYAGQPEILAYASHVADRFDLRKHFQFRTSLTRASWDENRQSWAIGLQTEHSEPAGSAAENSELRCRFLIMATGSLSAANTPDFQGRDHFEGETFHTGAWPAEGVDFTGKRVAVIGTGSSGIQSIPLIAEQAKQLTVFQRTANYSVPARNRPIDEARVKEIKANYREFRTRNFQQQAAFGADFPRPTESAFDVTDEQRQARFEQHWQIGGFAFLAAFNDISLNPEANKFAADFVRDKIRNTVKEKKTAEMLCPEGIIGCKRLCADSGYFETYNRDNVHLIDINAQPIKRFTATGIEIGSASDGQDNELREFDCIVFATGFDAMTGSLLRCEITGKDNRALRDHWSAGPRTYLGLMTQGFPNLFMMTGPGSPSVLANMITGAEQHAQFISDTLSWIREQDKRIIEPQPQAEDAWVDTLNARADMTLFPRCNSWYLGANVPGKPRVFMPYVGFVDYTKTLDEVAGHDYAGFVCTT